MPKLPGISHAAAVRVFTKLGFRIAREGKHTVMSNGRVRRLAERLPLQLGARNSELGTARLRLSPALGLVWVGLACLAVAAARRRKRSTGLFRDPANARRRFIPRLLADASRREEPVAICDLESA